MTDALVSKLGRFKLLPRKKKTSKSDYGHVLVVGGSKGLDGAAVLAATAALRSGSGLVTLATPSDLKNSLRRLPVEVMRLWLADKPREMVLEFVRKRNVSCMVLGPGLSVTTKSVALVKQVVQNIHVPVVLDADGLNSFKGRQAELREHSGPLVLTPHEKEFERLFNQQCPNKPSERLRLAKKLAKFYDVVLVLKGPHTLVVDAAREYTNRTGNPGMAKGGTGDVLAGLIASFIAQGLGIFEASAWAVYYHGLAGDLAVKEKGELGLTASDLIDAFPRAFRWGSSAGRAAVL
ncbi:MAG: NAD(P)H-hydrate dehydratase [Candidatus Omnitrophica bacterium]|nr:NAD(P)H-hydrate dehydratase [Candidatus Omnitrophota bacterium]